MKQFSGIKQEPVPYSPTSYSDAAKSVFSKYYDTTTDVEEQRTDDKFIFKIPQIPPPQPIRNSMLRGSIESVTSSIESITSSGYQSEGRYPIAGYPVGMCNIPQWLKSLRLHKYTYLFKNMTYDNMFTMTEDYLKSLNITQGASRKLANCIEKLKTRCETLKQTEISLLQNPNRLTIAEAIKEMESIVCSPMKPMKYQCENDPGYRLWEVLYLVFTQMTTNIFDDATLQSFQRIIDASMNSEAYTGYQFTLNDMKEKLLGRLAKKKYYTPYRF